ncbi:MAG: Flp family type IVb pilin [Bacillota bacterium]
MIDWLLGRILTEKGATVAEYALILALVVVVLIATLSRLGAVLNERLLDIIAEISNAG